MSVVSAGGGRGPPRGLPPRDFRPLKQRGRGYSHSDLDEPFLPKFSAVASEGVKIPIPQDEWGENTTVLTGVTSEHSYIGDDPKKVFELPTGRIVSRRCSRVFWLATASIVSFIAVVSAPVMCALPMFAATAGFSYPSVVCEVDCQGYLLLVAIKTLLLIVAIWALYWRRAVADLPRLYFARAAFCMFVLFVLFAFWLFYTVRILLEKHENYTYIVSYSLSLLDALLYTHYISVIVLELRKLRTEFVVTIVRDPDGETRTMNLGIVSLQEAAINVLRYYETTFPSYNVYLDKAKSGTKGRHGQGPTSGFKMYDIEGRGTGREMMSEVNMRALMEATARRRQTGHNEMIQNEYEWENRVKKRKYRLLAAAEDAFAHVQGVVDSQQSQKNFMGEPMDSQAAAQSVFTVLMKPLSKFLKVTRQVQHHPSAVVTQHIERCLSMRLGYRTFLQRFFSDRLPLTDIVSESKWSIISDDQASVSIQHGSTFLLRCHNKDENAGVQLLCTVGSLPFFNLTEQSRSSISKFALKISSESSV